MLRMAPEVSGRTKQFTIYDQDDSQSVIKRVMERLRISPKEFSPRAIHATISDAKNQLVSPAEFDKTALDPFAKAVAQVYPAYEEALRIQSAEGRAFCGALTAGILYALKAVMAIRVSFADELTGLDWSEHGEEAYHGGGLDEISGGEAALGRSVVIMRGGVSAAEARLPAPTPQQPAKVA